MLNEKIKTIGILTSGVDAPGMNAAIRTVVRAGISNGFSMIGIYHRWNGLIHNEMKTLTTEDVDGIISRGGTILRTACSEEFLTPEGRRKAYENMQKNSIDAQGEITHSLRCLAFIKLNNAINLYILR